MTNPNPLEQINPLHRGALRHDVARRLIEAIFRGEMPAGTHLVAKRLAEQLGISATPVREALVLLEQAGVVELQHNRGAVVRPFGRQQLNEMNQIRRILETEAVRCATGQVDDSVLAAWEKEIRRVMDLPRDAEGLWLQAITAADRSFHQTILDHCGNARLAEETAKYHFLKDTIWEIVGADRELHRHATETHLAIIEAMRKGDPDAAANAMANHVELAGRGVEGFLFAGN